MDESESEVPQSVVEDSIDLWYGDTQKFGQIGNPQEWVNILGNVSLDNAVQTLTYSLNGGPEQPLTVGPNHVRLAKTGDFNIEIAYPDLIDGVNTVEIKATDYFVPSQEFSKTLTLNYSAGNVWPINYLADWGSSSDIQDIAQVVDGKWAIEGDKLITEEVGYDRLVAIGDETWKDYEVTVPITVKSLEQAALQSGPGVGLLMRWQGHNQDPDNPQQPRKDFMRVGGIGWYRWLPNGTEGLELRGYDWSHGSSTAKVWDFNVPYYLKMSVQSSPTPGDERAYYRLKFWKQADPEPAIWDIEGWSLAPSDPDDLFMDSGSVVLVAHHVDAEFGNVQVKDINDLTFSLTTSVTGIGTVELDPPDVTEFKYGDRVYVTAVPDPAYALDSWSGDFSGDEETLTIFMTKDIDVTANFVEADPGSLTVNIEGQGTVDKNPDKTIYDGGEVVTITANPAPGYKFEAWSEDLTGTENPGTIKINGDKTVTAKFVPTAEAAPYSDNFESCELDSDLWTIVDPTGNGSVSVENGVVNIMVPAVDAHTLYLGNRDAVRIMQDAADQDMLLEAKFNSIPSKTVQIQGILVEEDEDNWIRFDVFSSAGQVSMFYGRTIGGNWFSGQYKQVELNGATEIYLRVNRSGDNWTPSYSTDGSSWDALPPFPEPLNVNKVGVFAGNEPDTTAPEFVAQVEHFKNMTFPEGGGYTIAVDEVGQGMVNLTPDSGSYSCDQEVEVEAVPNSGWYFLNWSGDASGSANPFKVTMNSDKSFTANFTEEVEYIYNYLPIVMKP
jgi:regulation of enolase protein 1 (concanavalin A-like superfamily)